MKNAIKWLGIAGCVAMMASVAQAELVTGNLLGLTDSTGAATTDANDTRQYSWTTSGGEVTVLYTLLASNGDLSKTFNFNSIFRNPEGTNLATGQSLTIALDSIEANAGYTLNSTVKTDSVSTFR